MSLILVLTIGQAVSSTLAWIGFYVGIRALPVGRAGQLRWIIGSAVRSCSSRPTASLARSSSTRIHRPPAQNLATAAARGVAALQDGRRSRMSVSVANYKAGLNTVVCEVSMANCRIGLNTMFGKSPWAR